MKKENNYKDFAIVKEESRRIKKLSEVDKNKILKELIEEIKINEEFILNENKKDIEIVKNKDKEKDVDRLYLNRERMDVIIKSINIVKDKESNIGDMLLEREMKSGIKVKKVVTALGVIGMIYESRPNVTVDAFILAFKSGNGIILKGGSEAENTNIILVKIIKKVLKKYDLENIIYLLDNDHSNVDRMLKANRYVDLVIPRGGKKLINYVLENTLIPIIQTGASAVHTFINYDADYRMSEDIVINEKIRRISVCNTLDTILIHKKWGQEKTLKLIKTIKENDVKIWTNKKEIAEKYNLNYVNNKDLFYTEWLSKNISIKFVDNINEVINHIDKYSFGHSESIITKNEKDAQEFLNIVDSACVYWNTSTAFSDGGEFGLGSEIGISTQKLHTRGPFGFESLVTTKWIIESDGKIRN